METAVFLEKLLKAFERYYSIKKDDVLPPFDAQAEFISRGEQYILVKSAKIAQIDSNESVYFKSQEELTFAQLKELAQKAWDDGTAKIKPYYGHKNSDVTLIVVTQKVSDDLKKSVKKIKYSKSYKFGIFGWSNFKLAIKELSSSKAYANRLGSDLKKLLYKIN